MVVAYCITLGGYCAGVLLGLCFEPIATVFNLCAGM
jgi:hypothetical protein